MLPALDGVIRINGRVQSVRDLDERSAFFRTQNTIFLKSGSVFRFQANSTAPMPTEAVSPDGTPGGNTLLGVMFCGPTILLSTFSRTAWMEY
jgi:hypothetical protein